MAVLGAIIGLVIAAPWQKPAPVLRPTGLTADSSTASSVALIWSGPATGPAPDTYEIVLNKFEYCVKPTNYVRNTLHFRIQVQGADVQGVTWTASSWAGTVTLDFPYAPVGNCYADTFKISVAGSSS